MPALAHQFARLVGSFHGSFSAARKTRVFRSLSVGHNFGAGARLARLIRDPSRLVNATPPLVFDPSGGDFPADSERTSAAVRLALPRNVLCLQNMYDRTENRIPGPHSLDSWAAGGYLRLAATLVNGPQTPISPEV